MYTVECLRAVREVPLRTLRICTVGGSRASPGNYGALKKHKVAPKMQLLGTKDTDTSIYLFLRALQEMSTQISVPSLVNLAAAIATSQLWGPVRGILQRK